MVGQAHYRDSHDYKIQQAVGDGDRQQGEILAAYDMAKGQTKED